MLETVAPDLVARLRGSTLRSRTGILRIPLPWLGREREIATRLGIGYADLQAEVLRSIAPGQRFLGVTWQKLLGEDLGAIGSGPRPDGDCVLIANVDLPLTSFSWADRERFWEFLRQSSRPNWGLLLAVPENDDRLITEAERQCWVGAERIARWA